MNAAAVATVTDGEMVQKERFGGDRVEGGLSFALFLRHVSQAFR